MKIYKVINIIVLTKQFITNEKSRNHKKKIIIASIEIGYDRIKTYILLSNTFKLNK